MKAAVLHEFHKDLVIEDVTVSEPAPDEVLVRVVASGVCHTDRTMQLGANDLPLPLVLGHEAAGIVERVGSAVTYVKPGDPVATCASAFCGSCRWCMRGELQHCERKRRSREPGRPPRLSQGDTPVEPFVGLGGFAEQLLVHESAVVKLPEEMPLDRAALLGCSVITGVGAVRNAAKVQVGQTVAVIGCGGVGLNVVQGARIAGAAQIIAIDRIPDKLALARQFGATHTVDASATDPVEAIQALTDGFGADVCIEAVGHPKVFEQAFYARDLAGTVVQVGVPNPEMRIELPMIDFFGRGGRLKPSWYGDCLPSRDFPMLVDLHLQGRLPLERFVSETIGLDEVEEAFHKMERGEVLRSVVVL